MIEKKRDITIFICMPIYRSPSNRLSEYDYSQAGVYFVTICIDRLGFGLDCPMFGKVVEDSVTLNEFGLFVEQQINQTQFVRPYVEMIGYVVMHDHIHMVLQIHNDDQQHHDRDRRDATLASIDGNN
jgi:putative transposase